MEDELEIFENEREVFANELEAPVIPYGPMELPPSYPSKYRPSSQRLRQVEESSDEELVQRCMRADDSVLINMAKQHKRIYSICYNELESRGLLKYAQGPPPVRRTPVPPQITKALRKYRS